MKKKFHCKHQVTKIITHNRKKKQTSKCSFRFYFPFLCLLQISTPHTHHIIYSFSHFLQTYRQTILSIFKLHRLSNFPNTRARALLLRELFSSFILSLPSFPLFFFFMSPRDAMHSQLQNSNKSSRKRESLKSHWHSRENVKIKGYKI